ncbi:MAG: tetratricopeptide repeat protein [Flavobacteriales bacterium]|nr:MAG: tetratricopeptide repeat protein [Flavobacteriales bacterium]
MSFYAQKSSISSYKIDYNILFNGEALLDEGIASLKQNHIENHWGILPVIEGFDFSITNSSPTELFKIPEEKAIKAIQKSNKKDVAVRDRAYLLLGKSRFYDQRYVSALQAFNNIENSLLVREYWKALVYMTIGQNELAFKAIEKGLNDKSLRKGEKKFLNLAQIQYYINNKNYDKAVKFLTELLASNNDKKLKARLNYVLAQIYLENKNYETAKVALKNVINSGINKSNSLILWSKLIYNNLINSPDYNLFKKLIRSERYRQNISLINYFNAKFILNSQPKQAKDLFSNALESEKIDFTLKSKIYDELYKIYLLEKDYLLASKYLDSSLAYVDPSTIKYFRLNKSRNKLKEVSKLEKENQLLDSLIYVNSLSENERIKLLSKSVSISDGYNNEMSVGSSSSFYFDNKKSVDLGIKKFKEKWGDILLTDDWKMNPQMSLERNVSYEKKPVLESADEPSFDKLSIDSLKLVFNNNMLRLGMSLNDYVFDYEKSHEVLSIVDNNLLEINDQEILLFYMTKASEKFDKKLYDLYKKKLLQNFPESIYSKSFTKESVSLNIDSLVAKIRSEFNTQKFKNLIKQLDSVLEKTYNIEDRYALSIVKSELIAKENGVDEYLIFLENLKKDFKDKQQEIQEKISVLNSIYKKKKSQGNKIKYVGLIVLEENCPISENQDFECMFFNEKRNLLIFYGSDEESTKKTLENYLKTNDELKNNKYFVISTPQFVKVLAFKTLDNLNY